MIGNKQESFDAGFCDQYERLLVRCQCALDVWAKRREEISQSGAAGKEIGAQLVKLQADFAKSYAILQRHTHQCALCQCVAKLASRGSQPLYLVSAHSSQPA